MTKLKLLKDVYKPTENEIQRSIMRFLDLKGIFNYPTHAGQIIPVQSGVSDIAAILPGSGRSLYIEVKLPGWRTPKEDSKQYKHYRRQCEFQDNVRKSGGVAFFATSVDDVMSQLEVMRPL
jgi:hypothetical protein